MTELEKLVKESTSLVNAVEDISSEIPKIKELFSECRKMKTDFSKLAKESEKALQKRINENISRLNTAVKEMDRSIEHCEKICRSFGDIENLTQLFGSYEERLSDLEQRMEVMAECLTPNPSPKEGTLLAIIKANQFKLPLRVKLDFWTTYEWEISKVSNGKAIGDVYNFGRKVESRAYPLTRGGFLVCSNDGFMDIPDGIEEELPFS